MEESIEPSPEDAKLVVLARATRMRAGAAEGAALRDGDGRTYAAASVTLPSLRLSAIAGCLAMAVAGGSKGVEAVVLLGADDVSDADVEALREFAGTGVHVYIGTGAGALGSSKRT